MAAMKDYFSASGVPRGRAVESGDPKAATVATSGHGPATGTPGIRPASLAIAGCAVRLLPGVRPAPAYQPSPSPPSPPPPPPDAVPSKPSRDTRLIRLPSTMSRNGLQP